MFLLQRQHSFRFALTISILLLAGAPPALMSRAADASRELVILPADVVLQGAGARQQLLVEAKAGETFTGDLTKRATFSSSNPVVAAVDAAGEVSAVQDGRAIIT